MSSNIDEYQDVIYNKKKMRKDRGVEYLKW